MINIDTIRPANIGDEIYPALAKDEPSWWKKQGDTLYLDDLNPNFSRPVIPGLNSSSEFQEKHRNYRNSKQQDKVPSTRGKVYHSLIRYEIRKVRELNEQKRQNRATVSIVGKNSSYCTLFLLSSLHFFPPFNNVEQ